MKNRNPFSHVHRPFTVRRVIGGNLRKDADLLDFLGEIARTYQVRAGSYTFLGSVQKARVSYYDQTERTYRPIEWEEPLEILHGSGNVSLLDQEIFVHAHVTLSDARGRALGGHLERGTPIFAGEFFLFDLVGEPFSRAEDEATGLKLWHE